MKTKIKLYFLSTIILTLLLSGLRTACFFTSFEQDVGYFSSTPLTLITTALYVLSTLWCLAAPFLFQRNATLVPENSIGHAVISKITGSILLFSGLCILIGSLAKTFPVAGGTAALLPILGISAVLSSAFFFTDGARTEKLGTAHAAFGFAVLVFLFAFLFFTYFNMYVTINSPIKNALQLSILSALFFLLSEIRGSIGRPRTRLSAALSPLCAFFCVPTAVSHLFFERSSLCNAPTKALISPFFSLTLLAIGIFALSRFPSEKKTDMQ